MTDGSKRMRNLRKPRNSTCRTMDGCTGYTRHAPGRSTSTTSSTSVSSSRPFRVKSTQKPQLGKVPAYQKTFAGLHVPHYQPLRTLPGIQGQAANTYLYQQVPHQYGDGDKQYFSSEDVQVNPARCPQGVGKGSDQLPESRTSPPEEVLNSPQQDSHRTLRELEPTPRQHSEKTKSTFVEPQCRSVSQKWQSRPRRTYTKYVLSSAWPTPEWSERTFLSFSPFFK